MFSSQKSFLDTKLEYIYFPDEIQCEKQVN